jgi:hypothetical protein
VILLFLLPVPAPADLELALQPRYPLALGAHLFLGRQKLAVRLRQLAGEALDLLLVNVTVALECGPLGLQTRAQ